MKLLDSYTYKENDSVSFTPTTKLSPTTRCHNFSTKWSGTLDVDDASLLREWGGFSTSSQRETRPSLQKNVCLDKLSAHTYSFHIALFSVLPEVIHGSAFKIHKM